MHATQLAQLPLMFRRAPTSTRTRACSHAPRCTPMRTHCRACSGGPAASSCTARSGTPSAPSPARSGASSACMSICVGCRHISGAHTTICTATLQGRMQAALPAVRAHNPSNARARLHAGQPACLQPPRLRACRPLNARLLAFEQPPPTLPATRHAARPSNKAASCPWHASPEACG